MGASCMRCLRRPDDREEGEESQPLLSNGTDDAGLVLPPQQVVSFRDGAPFHDDHRAPPPLQKRDQEQSHARLAPTVASVKPSQEGASVEASLCQNQSLDVNPKPPDLVQHVVQLPGRRRSLLIGINYYGTSSQLSGCVNDIVRVRAAISARFGFTQDEASQRVLLDEPGWPSHLRPTLGNIRAGISWLVAGANTGDALYLHYSGHGGRQPDGMGGYHETLCPLDLETAGELLDRELFETLVKPLPSGCRLTCFLDCCHSAGVLDLPYMFVGTKENIDRALAGEVKDMVVSKNWMNDLQAWQHGRSEELLGDIASMGLGLWDLYRKRQQAKEASGTGFMGSDASSNAGLAVGEVVAFTGCRSDQTSADVHNVHEQFSFNTGVSTSDHAGGALTAVFLESLENNEASELTYLSLLERMRLRLESEGFSQVPQLASSLLVELKQNFSLTTAFIPPDPRNQGEGGSGLDGTDAALLGGSAACAAGFLAALVNGPHGHSLVSSAHGSNPWPLGTCSPHRDLLTGGFEGEQHQNGWDGRVCSDTGALQSWGTVDHSRDGHADTGSLNEWGHGNDALQSWGTTDDSKNGFADTGSLNAWGHGNSSLQPWGTTDHSRDGQADTGSLNAWGHGNDALQSWGTTDHSRDGYVDMGSLNAWGHGNDAENHRVVQSGTPHDFNDGGTGHSMAPDGSMSLLQESGDAPAAFPDEADDDDDDYDDEDDEDGDSYDAADVGSDNGASDYDDDE